MGLTLYTVPVGATMREQFSLELKQLGFGKGVLLLPTGLLQEQVRQKYNIAVSSFDTLANKLLNLNGCAYLEEINYRSQQLVVEETIGYYAEQGKFKYLAGLKDKRGFVKHMTALLSQLSRSGATSEQISNALLNWDRKGNLRAKDEEVALIYQGYRNMLKLQDRFDLEGKYRLALKILREASQPRLPWQKVYISDFASLDALQLELLLELAKHCTVKLGICYDKQKAVCAASRNTVERLESYAKKETEGYTVPLRDTCLQKLVDNLGGTEAKQTALGLATALVVREYKHQQAEIKGVLAEIKEEVISGASLKDYAVAVYDLNSYTGLRLWADEYGIPLTLPKTEQLLVQPLTELLLKLLAAVPDNRQGVEAYFALLSSNIGKLLFKADVEGLEKLREDTFFKQRTALQAAATAALAGEKPQLLEQLDAFLSECKYKDTVSGFTQKLSSFIASLSLGKTLGELYKQEKITLFGLQSLLSTEKKLLESLRSLEEDYEKCGLAGERYTLQEFTKVWQEGLKEVSLMLAGGRKDGLLVTNVVQLQGASYKKVYLLGLREGEFPAGNRENWLYNDKERGELQSAGIDLPDTYGAYASDYCLFAGAVAAATERLCLSFYKDEEGEESPYINELQNIFTDLAITKIEAETLASTAEALRQSCSCGEKWLEQEAGLLTLEAAEIDKKRTGVYNGSLEDGELIEELQQGSRTRFSATSLGKYVDCPFKYLGAQLWCQKETSERSEQLDGGTRGSLFHDTLAEFVQTYLNGKPALAREQLWRQLMDIYEAKVAEYRETGKIYANEYWPMESKVLERMLSWWLDYELKEQQQWEGFTPMALEQGFGTKDIIVRLETEAGLPVFLTGRVDRIDASQEAAFITDYKSGGAPGNEAFEKGEDLQMAFYLLAAEKLCPDKTILGGNYLSLKKKTRQGGVAWSSTGNTNIKVNGKKSEPIYTSWDEVKKASRDMVLQPIEELYRGSFEVRPRDKDACAYCPLSDICRSTIVKEYKSTEAKEVFEDGQTKADKAAAGNN